MIVPEGFAGRVRLLAEQAGGVGALARRAGVSRGTLYNWINGTAAPENRDIVAQIAAAGGWTVEQLWGDAEPLSAAERTRLMELEAAVAQIRALVLALAAGAHPAPAQNGEQNGERPTLDATEGTAGEASVTFQPDPRRKEGASAPTKPVVKKAGGR